MKLPQKRKEILTVLLDSKFEKSGNKAPLQSVYLPQWELVRTSFIDTSYTLKPVDFEKPTPTPITASQRARIKGSIKSGKVKETQLKLDYERVKAEFIRTIKRSLPSS